MIEVTLLRHVKVDGPPALYGHTDIAPQVNENEQLLTALAQSSQFSSYDLVITSPLERCYLLAENFSKQCQIPLITITDFKEISFGDFDGVTFDDIAQSNSHDWYQLEQFWQAPGSFSLPHGETLPLFHHRVVSAWLNLIAEQFSHLGDDKKPLKVVLVTHGGVIRMILAHVLQVDWQSATWQQHLEIANASCTKITISRPFKDKNKKHCIVNYIGLPMLKEY